MKCVEREKIFAYMHDLLESREEGQVRAHLAECARCRGIIGEYRRLDAVLEEWKPVEPSPSFDARLRAAIERAAPARASSGWLALPSLGWLAPTVVVLLVVVSSVFVVRMRHARHHSETVRPQAAGGRASSVRAVSESEPVQDELTLYEDLPVLEDYDLLANFEVLSELPKSESQVEN